MTDGTRPPVGGRVADVIPSRVASTAFAHASEAEMARILDFYAVRWEYEPHTFPILWNLEGDVVESFAPDFWLPELDLYLELTTLRQKLVRKKNRKLRRLRELYPDVRIKLFYARDFRQLMLKYGKFALADALSGTPGQVVPVHPAALAHAAESAEFLPEPVASDAAEDERTDAGPDDLAAPVIALSHAAAKRRRRRAVARDAARDAAAREVAG